MKKSTVFIIILLVTAGLLVATPAITQKANASDSIRLNATPAGNRLIVTWITLEGGEASLQLSDASGKIRLLKTTGLRRGKNIISLNITGLTPGAYFLKLTKPRYVRTLKLVIGRPSAGWLDYSFSKQSYGPF